MLEAHPINERTSDAEVDPRLKEQLVEKAREIGALAWERVDEIERNRRLPDDVVEELVHSGLTDLLVSRRMGGLESTPEVAVEVVRELARQFPALGWLYGLHLGHSWYLSFANEELQQEIRNSPPGLLVDSLVSGGTAETVDGGYRLTGRWKFVSGVEWCSWAGFAVDILRPGAQDPEHVVIFLPREELTIENTWRTIGMRGTASNEVVLDGVFAPEHRVFPLGQVSQTGEAVGEIKEAGTLYKIPVMPMSGVMFAPIALGGAQRALDEFERWTKGRVRPYDGTTAREAPYAQLILAEATVRWDTVYAMTVQYARQLWTTAARGEGLPVSPEVRARYFAQRSHVVRECAELVHLLFLESGATALFESSPMQQIWRDTTAAAMHFIVGRGDSLTSLGRNMMGLPGHPFA